MIKYIFWDIDGTLLDFSYCESYALKKTYGAFGYELSDEDVAVYSKINDGYWTRFDRGEIAKAQIYEMRFKEFFKYLGVEDMPDVNRMNEIFQPALGEVTKANDNAEQVLDALRRKGHRQYVITNGSKVSQDGKLAVSGLGKYFDDIFISEEMGSQKPNAEFFQMCFDRIKGFERESAIIIGDSLTSDIRGGNNAGIKTCWYNPLGKEKTAEADIDFEIRDLSEIFTIIE